MNKKRDLFAVNKGVGKQPAKWKIKGSLFQRSERWIYGILPADEEAGSYEEERSDKPLANLKVIFVILFVLLIVRLYDVQIMNGSESIKKAEGNRIRETLIRAERGAIYDRRKIVLAKNIGNWEVSIIPGDLPKKETDQNKVYEKLAKIINQPSADMKKLTQKNDLDPNQPILIQKSIDRDTSLLLESKINELPGVFVSVNPIREYEDRTLLSHTLGYVGRISENEFKENKDRGYHLTDYMGKTGIEQEYESYLRGKDGGKKKEVDASGKIIKLYGQTDPTPGKNIILNIDYGLQQKAAEALQASMDKAKVKKGAVAIMNPNNGQVLSLVNLPSYDGNLFSKGISEEDYKKLIDNTDNPLLPRALSGEYPSGSIIKPLFAAAALQERIIDRYTTVLSTGGISVGQWNFPDWKAGGHGVTNVTKAIADSVNTFFYAISGGFGNISGLGPEKMKLYLDKFGLGKATNIDLPSESNGHIPDPDWKKRVMKEDWYLGDTYHFGIGQGDLLVTPIQMAKAISAIANGGTLYQPQILNSVLDADNKTVHKKIDPKIEASNFISKENIDIVKEGMRLTITSGSGRFLNDLPEPVAGKTGTAQFGPDNKYKHAWFATFGPYPNPEISIVVLLEEAGEGSEFAAPVAKEIYKYYFANRMK
ncbi:penicillin-binding protein 2 [bacterium CG2_30_37_16]|nr:MAG: penicillin-binding protein 2 [bacterium CG2_30_37_16]PIP31171.1 MAG: penicillin-binding protein 2 [bacterium (Candidatus Howlettbacteria) CG23_combo_of_CG06-09_8_20_14_all_37_9]PJB06543.1 MAG: penicillin-binding protein 2 [bacterium (Candidatus Howlettbacteria) CG_4_9_14_3_um_filter_37_10]